MPPLLRLDTDRVLFLLAALLGLALLTGSAKAEPPTRFTVTVSGQGPDVLLIPGLSCPASVWDATVARLQSTRRLHVLQVSGFAGTPAAGNAEGPVVGPLVEEIAAYIADQKIAAPAIIGHSMGGLTAMALAARHPAQVGRVLVVDASTFFPALMNPSATVETARTSANAIRDQIANLPQAAFAASQGMILERMITDPATRASLATGSGKSDPKLVARAMHDIMTTDLRPEVSKIQAPLTVLYAFNELQGTPVDTIDRNIKAAYANAPSARLIRVDDSRHFIMLDQPEKFAAAVDEFLNQ